MQHTPTRMHSTSCNTYKHVCISRNATHKLVHPSHHATHTQTRAHSTSCSIHKHVITSPRATDKNMDTSHHATNNSTCTKHIMQHTQTRSEDLSANTWQNGAAIWLKLDRIIHASQTRDRRLVKSRIFRARISAHTNSVYFTCRA